MSSKKPSKTAASLACCFGAGSSLILQRQLSSAGYGRLNTIEEGGSSGTAQKAGQSPVLAWAPAIQLGGKQPTSTQKKHSTRRRPVSIKCVVGNARECLRARAKEACEQVLEVAKRGTPHFNELFVGNKLLMQVTPSYLFSLSSPMVPSSGLSRSL